MSDQDYIRALENDNAALIQDMLVLRECIDELFDLLDAMNLDDHISPGYGFLIEKRKKIVEALVAEQKGISK